ncbi:MAG: ABC transporter ATP-binding protein [Chloroherpetonaceae bacterium]|nr:ABC transporter ATP-binding protein/permease [Chthonomonadaceae bacterium]MDW8207635.1 ABC transporter ATP-binding protein [Chloroherpetonaceae bacterium]
MQNLLRFIRELRPYRGYMFLVVILTLITAALGLPMPLIVQYLTDHLSDEAVRRNLPVHLAGVFIAIVGVATLSALFGYALSVTLTFLGQKFKYDMRRKLYAHMQTLSLGFFEKSQTGKLMSSITNDVAALDQLIAGSFATIVQDLVTLVAVVAFLFYKNWQLALIAFTVYPIYIANYLAFIGKIKTTHHEMREQRDMMYGDLQEKLAGVMVVKSYAKERFEVRQFVGETRSILNLNVRISALSTALWTLAELIGGVGTALLLWFGGRLVMQGQLTAGELMAFYGYIGGYLYGPTLRLIQINDQIARANAALWRIFRTLDTKPNVADKPDAIPLPHVRGDVHFENVWFEYEPGQPVIKGVDLKVNAGEMVALVGQSGSGKTTMIQLLQRNYDVTGGRITIDGYDLRDVQIKSLRQQIGVVIQETFLFNTTIRENIRYGKLDATDEEVEQAARAANIHHVIENLPMGYDTKIGEDGIKLSGGEKQRIAIARALLSDPRILILDEATSALDSETEALIQEALDRLMKGRTCFVIAHRLSTIVKADKIVVMEKGVIKEMGNHAELLAKGGVYAGLYQQQFRVALENPAGAPQQAMATG